MPPKRKEPEIDLPSVPVYDQLLEVHEHEATPLLGVPPRLVLLARFIYA